LTTTFRKAARWSSPTRPLRRALLRAVTLGVVSIMAIVVLEAPGAGAWAATSVDAQRALASYKALQRSLYVPAAQLYQGLPSNGCDPYSCLWPYTNATAATVYLDALRRGAYGADVSIRFASLSHYADLNEVSPAGDPQPPAYQSAVAPPDGPGGNTYYDDNAWTALDLIEGYDVSGDSTYLTMAQDVFNFVITGWDTSSTDGCPGGVFWEDVAGSQRNATANAANAEVGLELYQRTNDASDLNWALQMYQWVNTCLATPSGLYDDHVNPNGSVNTTIWSYNQGTMIGADVLLYEITGNSSYLVDAQQTATASVAHFGTGATLENQGPAFNSIYFRNLFVLKHVAPSRSYAKEASVYASFMWTQRQSSTGLFLQNGNTNGVNGTAPMVEIYALLGGAEAHP
jgi:hypothetical protein